MLAPNQIPLPSDNPGGESLYMIDPETSMPVSVGDMRAEFERLSQQVPRDPEAERAFVESKIEMIRNDPNLSQIEKERAVEQLRLHLP
jgi:hypothetical protein